MPPATSARRWLIGTGAAAGAAAVGAAAWLHAAEANRPRLAEVTLAACGVPASSASFALPLATIAETAPGLAMRVGPIHAPGVRDRIYLEFDPLLDGLELQAAMAGDTIRLPFGFGRSGQLPERVAVDCRDGRIATVRYQAGGGRALFHVVEGAAAADPSAGADPQDSAAVD